MNKRQLKKLDTWHEKGCYDQIIAEIAGLPEQELDYTVIGHLARAYNNAEEYEQAVATLMKVEEQGRNDALWLFRLGYAYYYLDQDDAALDAFQKCRQLNPDEPDVDLFLSALIDQDIEDNHREYWELHLETAAMPVSGKRWENSPSPAFFLDITQHDDETAYEVTFSPFEDESEALTKLNWLIEQKGFTANGSGWEDFLCGAVVDHNAALSFRLISASDEKTCRLLVRSQTDYIKVLRIISTTIRSLYVCTPTADLPEDFEYVPEMAKDDYYPPKLVERIVSYLQKTAAFIASSPHTYEQVQREFDKATENINALEEKFDEQGSEIETVARESIGDTVARILAFFQIDIDTETAIRQRDW